MDWGRGRERARGKEGDSPPSMEPVLGLKVGQEVRLLAGLDLRTLTS